MRAIRRSTSLIRIIAAGLCGTAVAAAPPATLPIAAAPVAAPPVVPPAATAPAAPVGTVVPALTPVKVEIRQDLVSKVSKPGAFFPLRLAAPILVNGAVAVPAGTEGMGEVVESKGGGMAGGAGILILAARHLTVDGQRLRLRSMHIAQSGADNRAGVDAAMLVFGMIGAPAFFISGGKTAVAAGTVADAKTAEAFTLGPVPASATPDAPATVTSTTAAPQITASAQQNNAPERKTQ